MVHTVQDRFLPSLVNISKASCPRCNVMESKKQINQGRVVGCSVMMAQHHDATLLMESTVPKKRSKWESDPAADEAAARQKAHDRKRRKAQALREEHQQQQSQRSQSPSTSAAQSPVPSTSKQTLLESVEKQPPSRHALPSLAGCRSVYCYERLNHIEEGSYGVVSRAREKDTGDM